MARTLTLTDNQLREIRLALVIASATAGLSPTGYVKTTTTAGGITRKVTTDQFDDVLDVLPDPDDPIVVVLGESTLDDALETDPARAAADMDAFYLEQLDQGMRP